MDGFVNPRIFALRRWQLGLEGEPKSHDSGFVDLVVSARLLCRREVR